MSRLVALLVLLLAVTVSRGAAAQVRSGPLPSAAASASCSNLARKAYGPQPGGMTNGFAVTGLTQSGPTTTFSIRNHTRYTGYTDIYARRTTSVYRPGGVPIPGGGNRQRVATIAADYPQLLDGTSVETPVSVTGDYDEITVEVITLLAAVDVAEWRSLFEAWVRSGELAGALIDEAREEAEVRIGGLNHTLFMGYVVLKQSAGIYDMLARRPASTGPRTTFRIMIAHPFCVDVLTPTNGRAFASRERIEFSGRARDLIGAPVDEFVTWQWTSDKDGAMSSSQRFSSSTLKPGPHRITLEARHRTYPIYVDSAVVSINVPEPSAVLFLLDVSGSMSGAKIEQARASGVRTVQTLKTNQDSAGTRYKASVAVFGGGCQTGAARTVLDFTDDLARVEQTFRSGIPAPSGATPLHLARGEAEEMIERYRQANGGGRGEIVLLSDGMDTCESTRPAGTYSRAVGGQAGGGAGVRYLAVGFDLAPGSPAERDLQYLASMSEGRYFNAKDQRQLTRAFEKLLKAYVPRPSATVGGAPAAARAAFDSGSSALAGRHYAEARRAFERYAAAQPQDPAGWFNLAQALEATDRYRGAAAAFRRYLAAAPQASDRAAVQAMLPVLERDYTDHFAYQVELIRSDLAYLESYYQRLFNQDNASLAAEFRGFVREKGEFYANLSDALEIEAPWVEAAERDVGQSIQRLARRVDSPTFDRDAVSLLAVPIGHLETLVGALSAHRP